MKLNCLKPAFTLLACAGFLLPGTLPAQTVLRNILLVIGDDIGTDALSLFNTNTAGTSFAPTPNLDALARQGVMFGNCYGYPSGSPTRSCLLTGRYGFRTGLGSAIDDPHDPYLSPREFTIPKALDANPQLGFRHAHVGKWHLSEAAIDPNLIGGWSHYSGYLAGERESYFDWEKTVNGITTPHTTNYCTSDSATDAINWINAQGTNRWFLWFAPKAAHSPLHKPPNELHSYDFLPPVPPTDGSLAKLYYQAMIEALDTEMGRVLTNLNLAETGRQRHPHGNHPSALHEPAVQRHADRRRYPLTDVRRGRGRGGHESLDGRGDSRCGYSHYFAGNGRCQPRRNVAGQHGLRRPELCRRAAQ
jgi:arylsulfatase A-like enzyme